MLWLILVVFKEKLLFRQAFYSLHAASTVICLFKNNIKRVYSQNNQSFKPFRLMSSWCFVILELGLNSLYSL